MNTNLSYLKRLRLYQRFSILQLLNFIFCNRVANSKFLVSNAMSIYRMASVFPGKWLTNKFIGATFSKMFTAGETLQSLGECSKYFANRNIPIIVNYCAEGVVNNPKGPRVLDQNAHGFARSASFAAQRLNNTMSIKISALINMDLLQKYNRSVVLLDKIWRESSENGLLQPDRLFECFQKMYGGFTEEDFVQYLEKIHNFSGSDPAECIIDEVDFKINHHPYYLYEPQKNEVLISKLILPLDEREKEEMKAFIRRINEILEPEFKNPNNLRILGDAEQSYVQKAIESILFQLQLRYNKKKVYVVPTLQNYLKQARSRLRFQLEAAKRKQLQFGVKLVRGAYLVEENQLARMSKSQSPVQDTFDNTTQNYLANFQAILISGLKGEVFLAGHNSQTIQALLKLKRQGDSNVVVSFGQLLGLGDHLTMLLKGQGQRVYKLLSWGPTEIMVPFMIRRGQQFVHSSVAVSIQYSLLVSELRLRVLGF